MRRSIALASPADEPDDPTFSIETVTPALAQEWLTFNVRNRPLRLRRVNEYARDMAAGNWRLTGEAIKFATDGTLLDGQNRLHAVIQADAPVRILVARNVEADAQDVMDTGAKRQASDMLNMHGHGNATLLASTAKWCVLYDADMIYVDRAARAVTHSDIEKYVADNVELAEAVTLAGNLRRHIDLQPSVLATAVYLTRRLNPNASTEFFSRVADGAGLPAGSPILALRSRLREIKNNRQRVEPEALISLTVRAWNAWRKDRRVATFPIYNGKNAIRCPDIES